MKDCNCKDWEYCSHQLARVLDSARIHGVYLSPHYKYFKYCPWCGKKGEE